MKELSIFIDESGDFGEYDYHSPWYIVTMVFHEQEASIQEPMEYLNRELRNEIEQLKEIINKKNNKKIKINNLFNLK